MERIKCYGGCDTCEDVTTPLMKALDLDWKSDMMYICLFVDAPTHGKSYHKNEIEADSEQITDEYLDEDKGQLLEKLSYHLMECKINLCIVKFTNDADMMIKLMLSLIHICRCRRIERCRSRWSPYH
eukprot:TRINITY_DN14895_c0_g1_i3.p1 TRINITY_DN14895_c0_g1~~TRINITY_DN14895_c0_g1_i3.p1  ORF type:complete len:127 (+),score=14.54 TRINITY_DN14895_c0_g1_i3:510-890(+)